MNIGYLRASTSLKLLDCIRMGLLFLSPLLLHSTGLFAERHVEQEIPVLVSSNYGRVHDKLREQDANALSRFLCCFSPYEPPPPRIFYPLIYKRRDPSVFHVLVLLRGVAVDIYAKISRLSEYIRNSRARLRNKDTNTLQIASLPRLPSAFHNEINKNQRNCTFLVGSKRQ